MCGEKSSRCVSCGFVRGSPPRVRGEGLDDLVILENYRITPACAGRRLFCYHRECRKWDHPRVCGEKCRKPRHYPPARGSPPRVRGEGRKTSEKPALYGITPACAGRSSLYPAVDVEQEGSPPRVRGEVLQCFRIHRLLRITPACAGRSSR